MIVKREPTSEIWLLGKFMTLKSLKVADCCYKTQKHSKIYYLKVCTKGTWTAELVNRNHNTELYFEALTKSTICCTECKRGSKKSLVWKTGWNKMIRLTDHFVHVVIFSTVREDITENGTYITMQKLLSEEVQVYGSRARPFIENKLSISAWHTDQDSTNKTALQLHLCLSPRE